VQLAKAGVYFAGDAARPRPRPRPGVGRPHGGVLVGQVFGDGDALPDLEALVVQAGSARVFGDRLERRAAPGCFS